MDYRVVRVDARGGRAILNEVSGHIYRSSHKELNGRKMKDDEGRMKVAEEIAEGWAIKGPWPDCEFVVEEVRV